MPGLFTEDTKVGGDDNSKKPKKRKNELMINGEIYDVTEFAKRHPGGKIIRFAFGTDATDTFNQFHFRSERAKKILKTFPKRNFDPKEDTGKFYTGNKKFVEGFRKLETELKEEGYFEPSPAHICLRTLELFGLHVIGCAFLLYGNSSIDSGSHAILRLMGFLFLGIGSGRCGWMMHEAGHMSLTGTVSVDRRIQEFFYGFGCGMSGGWWRSQHNRHHASPQKIEHDVDLATLPLVAFNSKVVTDTKFGRYLTNNIFFRTIWLPFQHYLFCPVICLLVALSWQFYLHPRYIMFKKLYMEAFWFIVRCVFWNIFFFHFLHYSVSENIQSYLLYNMIASSYIFVNFAVSHTHLDAIGKDEHRTWLEYASDYTINCTNCIGVNWWMCYLNFQIEHHLFPTCPQFRFPRISHRVRKLFEEECGKKYNCLGYFDALQITFRNLQVVGSTANDEHHKHSNEKSN